MRNDITIALDGEEVEQTPVEGARKDVSITPDLTGEGIATDWFALCPKNEPCTPHGCEAGGGKWPRCPQQPPAPGSDAERPPKGYRLATEADRGCKIERSWLVNLLLRWEPVAALSATDEGRA